MPKLLYLEASPRKERSHSIDIANEFMESYREHHPTDEIEVVNIWELDLPAVNGETLNARYAIVHGQQTTPEQEAAWKEVVGIFERFNSATKYLFSLPMWNFGIPYRLKHFIDVVTQPGLAFSFSPESGYQGLITGRPASVVYARGGEYGIESGVEDMDFQKPYFEAWLRFIGFTDIRPVVVEPTMKGEEMVDLVKAFNRDHIRKIAQEV